MIGIVLLALGALIAFTGAIEVRRLRRKNKALLSRYLLLRERIETFSNYTKLAEVRLAEGLEERKDLNRRLTEETRKAKQLGKEPPKVAAKTEPGTYHVFDRVSGLRGGAWMVVVESRREDIGWRGIRHYVVVAENAEEAGRRAKERFPPGTGFAIYPAVEMAF